MRDTAKQDERYQEAVDCFGNDIARFVAGYEMNPAKRRELVQEIYFSLWQSLAAFDGRCTLRTWVYRVAHNVGVSHVQSALRAADRGALGLDAADAVADERADIEVIDRRLDLQRVMRLVHSLPPMDRQMMLLYLEDLDAASIAEITGLSIRNVATKVHRIKKLLAARFNGRGGRA